jgi:hypothetical protein
MNCTVDRVSGGIRDQQESKSTCQERLVVGLCHMTYMQIQTIRLIRLERGRL